MIQQTHIIDLLASLDASRREATREREKKPAQRAGTTAQKKRGSTKNQSASG
jgi:hypothetical protein